MGSTSGECRMKKQRKWLWISATAAAQILGCASTVQTPTVAVAPARDKSPSAFADDNSSCRTVATQQSEAAKNAANMQIAGSAITNAAVSAGNSTAAGERGRMVAANAAAGALTAVIVSGQVTQATLQRRFDLAYAECMYARGDSLPGLADAPARPPSTVPGSAQDLLQIARSRLLGVWRGSYVCSQGETGVDLAFSELFDDGAVLGTFSFYNLPGQGNSASGAYTLIGQLDVGHRTIYLDPGTWIRRPPGYAPVGVAISFPSSGERAISGTITNSGCSQISVAWTGG
jgi:hypothetical protein